VKRQRIPNRFGGSDYRIGDYVAIKEDEEFFDGCAPDVRTQDRGIEVISKVTWGAVPVAWYDQRHGEVGLPDAVMTAGTLTKLQAMIEEKP
jgi:hypothetical protein